MQEWLGSITGDLYQVKLGQDLAADEHDVRIDGQYRINNVVSVDGPVADGDGPGPERVLLDMTRVDAFGELKAIWLDELFTLHKDGVIEITKRGKRLYGSLKPAK